MSQAPRNDVASGTFAGSSLIDHAKTLDCIHCGLCLQTCPTYRLTGVESSSPRGRIHLMRSVAEGTIAADRDFAEEMDFCLLCRHCETACPAGVQFGALMEHTRDHIAAAVPRSGSARLARWIGFRVVLPNRFVLSVAAYALRFLQRTGLVRLTTAIAARFGVVLPGAPEVPRRHARRALPVSTPPEGSSRGPALLLEGCVMPVLFGSVNRATARSVANVGYEARPLPGVTCCGSLHAHNGDLDGARMLARRLLRAARVETGREGVPAPVVVNSAGCSAHLKELAQLFPADDPDRAAAVEFAQRVYDFAEFVAPRVKRRPPERSIEGAWPGPFVWDDPCHLCHGQGIRAQPREVLDEVPGATWSSLENSESCCGSAGIYSMLRPADSRAVLAPKLDALERSGARTLVTANPGCQLQWESGIRERGLDVRVVHLAELLARAYDGRTAD